MPRRIEGSVVEIELGGGQRAYARVLSDPLFAFFDIGERPTEPVGFAGKMPIFTLCVMRRAVTSGRWAVIAKWPLEKALTEPVRFFRQDALNGRLSIYTNGDERPADITECIGLERAAVWDPEHVEDRLRDHLAGVPNRWVESMKLNIQRIPEAAGARFMDK